MTENETTDAVTKVARDLSAIEDMTAALLTQAVHKANDHEIPGGAAMVALAHVANQEAWEHRYEAAEAFGADTSYAADEDETWAPPLQTLCFWSEAWRQEHNSELEQRPTIVSETNFIRQVLGWAWENEPHFEDFARDVNAARRRLEDVLYAGRRTQRSRVTCTGCDKPIRLIKVYSQDESDTQGEGDHWKCPACKTRYDRDEYGRAYAKQLRSHGAHRFVPLRDALATLKAQGRGERTVRQWIADGEVETDLTSDGTRRVWWPDLWRLHLMTPTRKRAGAA